MKKELKELITSKKGELQINELFVLKRWILDEQTDILGRNGDYLELEMTNKYGKTRSAGRMINGRTTKEIMDEVATAMPEMMDELKETLLKSWNGGYIF